MAARVERVDAHNAAVAFDLRFDWRSVERGEVGLDRTDYQERARQWFVEHEYSHEGFLVYVEEDPVGVAWLLTFDRVPGPANFVRRGGMIQSVYVDAPRRNAGIGSDLMQVVIEHARAKGLEYLIVHPSLEAFPFYRRLGFGGADKALELRFTT